MTPAPGAAPTTARPPPPPDQDPRAELARADELLARAERHLAGQQALAEELAAADGPDGAAARQAAGLVGTLRRSLEVLRHRRRLAVAALAAARGGE
jgi:hypothetical protein